MRTWVGSRGYVGAYCVTVRALPLSKSVLTLFCNAIKLFERS